jgi:hypothetical protein
MNLRTFVILGGMIAAASCKSRGNSTSDLEGRRKNADVEVQEPKNFSLYVAEYEVTQVVGVIGAMDQILNLNLMNVKGQTAKIFKDDSSAADNDFGIKLEDGTQGYAVTGLKLTDFECGISCYKLTNLTEGTGFSAAISGIPVKEGTINVTLNYSHASGARDKTGSVTMFMKRKESAHSESEELNVAYMAKYSINQVARETDGGISRELGLNNPSVKGTIIELSQDSDSSDGDGKTHYKLTINAKKRSTISGLVLQAKNPELGRNAQLLKNSDGYIVAITGAPIPNSTVTIVISKRGQIELRTTRL